MESSLEKFAKKVIIALNESEIDYVIIGGFAAIVYGRPRTTMDIDIIINLEPENRFAIKKLVNILSKYDLETYERDIMMALNEKSHFSIFDKATPLRIDAKGIYRKLDRIALVNRRKIKVFGIEAWFEAPEDLIVAKLAYGSQQDIEDVIAVLVNLKDQIDLEYLKKRAIEEHVDDILRKVLSSV